MSSQGEQRLRAVLDEFDDVGYHNDEGEFIEHPEVQERLIEEWFKLATNDDGFDVWSTVSKGSNIVESDPFADNLRRVCRSFHEKSEQSLEEVEEQIVEWEQEHGEPEESDLGE